MTRYQTVVLVLLGILLIAAAVGIGVVLLRQQPAEEAPLPTLVVLAEITERPTQTPLPPTATPTVTLTTTATTEATGVPSATPTATVTLTATPGPPTATTVDLSQPTRVVLSAGDLVLTQNASVTLSPAAPANVAPLPTSDPNVGGGGGGESGEGINIGVGDLYVISVARPGDTLIQEIGGTAPAAPEGQVWVVVELLLICAGSDNCAPDATALTLVSGSGVVNAPVNVELPVTFGPEGYAIGQVWGYAAFLAPANETELSLNIVAGGQTHSLRLQQM